MVGHHSYFSWFALIPLYKNERNWLRLPLTVVELEMAMLRWSARQSSQAFRLLRALVWNFFNSNCLQVDALALLAASSILAALEIMNDLGIKSGPEGLTIACFRHCLGTGISSLTVQFTLGSSCFDTSVYSHSVYPNVVFRVGENLVALFCTEYYNRLFTGVKKNHKAWGPQSCYGQNECCIHACLLKA